ncbi:hypothetical protein [Shimia abyssi]|uniref:Translocase n=1 Tax=Shimia abyssi TaxID=1662395 RepID=A0A2P8F8H7_9RHOB|nr:hypothetical protein [Shimia abyssi]PSL18008.1 hypothetical protein CLV88_11379 [Shimia abyssi]
MERKMSKMKNVYRRYALAGATFSIAISIGFFMQSSEASQAPAVSARHSAAISDHIEETSLSTGLTQPQSKAAKSLPPMPEDATLQAELPKEPLVLIVSKDVPVGMLPQEEHSPALGCDVLLDAKTAAAAMLEVYLTAPCQAGERVTFEHKGLRFTEIVGAEGYLQVLVPALSEEVDVVATFANGDHAVTSLSVDSAVLYERAVLQGSGIEGLQLHALEFGASYGTSGHVSADTPRELTAVIDGKGGFLIQLGDPGIPNANTAEVYTFPSGSLPQQASIRVTVEAEISETNCGQHVSGQSIEMIEGKIKEVHEYSLHMPDCDAIGEFLVLKNLLQDLTIAQN